MLLSDLDDGRIIERLAVTQRSVALHLYSFRFEVVDRLATVEERVDLDL